MKNYKLYQDYKVEHASQIGLVLLTYEALFKSLAKAKQAIENGDLAAEAEHTSRATEALIELATSLDMEKGKHIAANLASLYSYMIGRLTKNVCSGNAEAVEEVMHLVEILRSGWEELAAKRAG